MGVSLLCIFALHSRRCHMCAFLCILDMSSSSLSSPLNVAWANRTVDGWNYICGNGYQFWPVRTHSNLLLIVRVGNTGQAQPPR